MLIARCGRIAQPLETFNLSGVVVCVSDKMPGVAVFKNTIVNGFE